MEAMSPIDIYYTEDEVAERLKVSPRVVMNLYRAGTIKGTKFGKAVRFSETALKEYLGEKAP